MTEALVARIRQAREAGRPLVMGILNVTPDSFSDGGRFDAPDRALQQALRLATEGADIIDVGGESTRPGAEPVGEDDELARVIPVIKCIVESVEVPVSIDTTKPSVMRAAVEAGATMVNDVNGLRADSAVETVAALGVPVCLMHMQGEPRTMQQNPHYDDIVGDIRAFFDQRLAACREAGMDPRRIVLDPGFGFGKSLEHNLELLARLGELNELGCPILAGLSRKTMLGTITGRQRADQRVAASVAAALIAAQAGAAIVRVHDVSDTVDALKVLRAVEAGAID